MTRKELQDQFILGIEKERTALGLTQSEMAKFLEMSPSGYKKMIAKETSRIDLYLASRIYDLTGKLLCEICDDPIENLETFQKFRELSPQQKRFVNSIIDFELDFKTNNSDEEDYITLFTPTGNMEDGMIWDSCNTEKLNVAACRKRFGEDLHCAIRVTSNHLHPAYLVGDILLICQKPPRDGDTGIFINKENGRVYLRKFRQTNPCLLLPINGLGATFTVDSYNPEDLAKWMKFGYVLSKMRE